MYSAYLKKAIPIAVNGRRKCRVVSLLFHPLFHPRIETPN